jgi:hypothetical protein
MNIRIGEAVSLWLNAASPNGIADLKDKSFTPINLLPSGYEAPAS